jgi:hypothetical protein
VLLVRRGVELPEAFLRADRDRETRRQIIGALLGTLLAGAVVGGVIFVARRRQSLLADGMLTTRGMVTFAGALGALAVAQALDALPDALFQYDTAVPWNNFIFSTTVGLMLAVLPALVAVGLWLMLGAMRRRAGIPMLPAAVLTDHPHDVLLAGLGLGSTMALVAMAAAMMKVPGVPPPPTTLLDRAVPLLGDTLVMPISVVMSVAALAIPMLTIAAISRRTGVRALLVLLLVVLVGATARVSTADPAQVSAGEAALTLLLLAGGVAAVRWWAPLCAWVWVVAVLAQRAVAATQLLIHAPTGTERVAAVASIAMAAVLGAAALRRAVPPAAVRVE